MHYFQYNIYVNIYIILHLPPFHCILFCLHIYNTLVTIMTNTPRLYQVVVKYYHIFSNNTGKHCIFAINQHKVKWHYIDDFTNAILFIASSTAGSSCCWLLQLLHTVALQQPNPTPYCLSLTFYVFRLYNKPIHK